MKLSYAVSSDLLIILNRRKISARCWSRTQVSTNKFCLTVYVASLLITYQLSLSLFVPNKSLKVLVASQYLYLVCTNPYN